MAGGKGDGDRSIGSRHILGLFFGVVVLCCIFFTLGYVMGRDQARGSVRGEPLAGATAAGSTPPAGWSVSTPATGAAPAGKSGDAGAPAKPPESKATGSSTPARAAAEPKKPASSASKFAPPLIPRGAIVLQIAALTKDSDALAMASALQEKGFPTFVLTSGTDNFFRVQVGPFADAKSADQAKRSLEQEGFKPIVKR
jgi:DedD protein